MRPARLRSRGFALGIMSMILTGCGTLLPHSTAIGSIANSRGQDFPVVQASPPNPTVVDFSSMQWGLVGMGHEVMETQNGGKNWSSRSLLQKDQIPTAIDFLSPQRGWVVGLTENQRTSSLALLYTTDSGHDWQAELRAAGDRAHIDMLSSQSGYVILGNRLYRTFDGGKRWRTLSVKFHHRPQQIDFVTPEEGYVTFQGSHQDYLMVTMDGGIIWSPVYQTRSTIGEIDFSSLHTGAILIDGPSGAPMVGELLKTTNGGATWSVVAGANLAKWGNTPATGFPMASSYSGTGQGWIALSSGAMGFQSSGLMITANGGESWRAVGGPQGWNIVSMAMVRPGKGWILLTNAANDGPVLLKTVDNGQHFTSAWSLSPMVVDMVSRSRGYGLGDGANNGAIMATTNGGTTWNVVDANPPGIFSAISFHGVIGLATTIATTPAGNYEVKIYRTNNGGRSWHVKGVVPSDFTENLKLLSTNDAIMGTNSGLYLTQDGGIRWTAMSTAANFNVQTADFVSAADEWNVEDDKADRILQLTFSANDGKTSRIVYTWPRHHDITYLGLPVIDFLNRRQGWVEVTAIQESNSTFKKPGDDRVLHKTMILNYLEETTNGGRTWIRTFLPGDLNLVHLDFISQQWGFMTANNAMYVTSDGGRFWHLVAKSPLDFP